MGRRRPSWRQGQIASLIIAFSAALFGDQISLRPGERATVMCLAVDREQAQIILNFTRVVLRDDPAVQRASAARDRGRL